MWPFRREGPMTPSIATIENLDIIVVLFFFYSSEEYYYSEHTKMRTEESLKDEMSGSTAVSALLR